MSCTPECPCVIIQATHNGKVIDLSEGEYSYEIKSSDGFWSRANFTSKELYQIGDTIIK